VNGKQKAELDKAVEAESLRAKAAAEAATAAPSRRLGLRFNRKKETCFNKVR